MSDSHASEQFKTIQIKNKNSDFLIKKKRNLKKNIFLQILFSWSKNTGNREIFLKLKNDIFEKSKTFELQIEKIYQR